MKCCPPGKLIRDSVPGVFMGGWSHRHPEPSTYQEACLPEGKRTFNINHTVYISSLVRHSEPSISVLRMVGNRLKSKFPDTRQRPTLLAGLSKNSSLRSAVVFSAQPTWLLGTKQMLNILGFYCQVYLCSKEKPSYHLYHAPSQRRYPLGEQRTGASIYARVCYLYP